MLRFFGLIPVVVNASFIRLSTALLLFSLLIFTGVPVGSAAAADFKIANRQAWVSPEPFAADVNIPDADISSGVFYLLVDRQVRVASSIGKDAYYHQALKVANSNGITEAAQISIDFEPEYELVTLHAIRVHRGGTVSDQLDAGRVKVLQRETQLEDQIYDGRKTLNVILDDIRVGDVIEYSYTTSGENPVFGGHYMDSVDFGWSVPVHRLRHRLLWPQGRSLYIKNHNFDLQPVVRGESGFQEYLWTVDAVPPLFKDSETPDWFDPYPWVQLSDFATWEDVVAWALPYYQPPNKVSPELAARVAAIATEAEDAARVLAVLRFVQDEIRYMGVEIGPRSHAPSDPSQVLVRRFGDCKEKTLLAMTMLRQLGIDAYPALVHTDIGQRLPTFHPTPFAFNHVILKVSLSGRTYWLDPTKTLQGGGLEQIYQPRFENALVVSPVSRDLEPMRIAVSSAPIKTVQDTYDLRKGVGEEATYTVRTVYSSVYADYIRRQLAAQSMQELQNDYLNFYAESYPSIRVAGEMEVEDDLPNNRLTVTEHYLIPEMWQKSAKRNRNEAYFIPLDFRSVLSEPDDPQRSMPFSIAYPMNVHQKTVAHLPEEWTISPDQIRFEDPAFNVDIDVAYADETLTIDYRYKSINDHVPAAAVAGYQEKVDAVRDEAWFSVYIQDDAAAAPASGAAAVDGQSNWLTIMIALTVLLLSLVLAGVLFFYDPAPAGPEPPPETASGIGGWLILVVIGIVASPVRVFVDVLDFAWVFELGGSWYELTTPGSEQFHPFWAPGLIFEVSANILLFVLTLLLAVLFFMKRSSVPRLYVAVHVAALLIAGLDLILTSGIPAVAENSGLQNWGALGGRGFVTAIWCAYILTSKRVRATFVRRRREPDVSASTRAPSPGQADSVAAVKAAVRYCPRCATAVVKKTASGGPHKGKSFLVCGAWPECRHVEPLTG